MVKSYETGIRAYPGWNYIVLQFFKYGIADQASNQFTKLLFEARSSNIKTTYTSEGYINSFIATDLYSPPVDPVATAPPARILFGHLGPLTVVEAGSSYMHMNGILRLFLVTTNAYLTSAQIDTNFNTLKNVVRMIPDIKYSMNYDLSLV